ncbi:MAG TPA: pitrilysin family protein [Saprospiraceae bacterium]|nr:pitrilysin family protein [Saprospiraceae bacterium]HPI05061.1 pitrilysin family protein [Saprospiraceae bacterium]
MQRLTTLFVLLVLTAGHAFSQKIQFVEYDMANGLKVLLHEDHSTPIVAVSVMYHVGSKNEKPNRSGFAHFFEHLLFEGSDNIKRGEFDDYINNAGGTNNANTWYDRTYYYEVLPSNQLALGLWLESERMLHAKVEQVGIETQRQVVKEERRQRIDNQPYGKLLEETLKRVFVVHPYKSSVIGSMEDLDAAQENDYKQFYKDFYRPDNAILSIAGDINIAQAKELINVYFKDIPRGQGTIQRTFPQEPPMKGETRDTIYDDVQLPAVVMGYHIPAQGTKDFYAVQMLGQLLSQGESSRMNKIIVDEQQKAVAAGSFPLQLEDPGANLTYAIANMGVNPADLEKSMDAVVEDLQKNLIPEKEFQKLQNQVENDFISANASVGGIAESLANYEMYFGDANLINTELDRYRKVTREDLRAAANKYFNKNARVVLYWLPKTAP